MQIFGSIVYALVSILVYVFLSYLLGNHLVRIVLVAILIVLMIVTFLCEVAVWGNRLVPRFAVARWIATEMRQPAQDDPLFLDNVCAICFDVSRNTAEVRLTVCNHVYHIRCLAKWLTTMHTCPTCRQRLRPPGWFPRL